eukprot:s1310_g2.t1
MNNNDKQKNTNKTSCLPPDSHLGEISAMNFTRLGTSRRVRAGYAPIYIYLQCAKMGMPQSGRLTKARETKLEVRRCPLDSGARRHTAGADVHSECQNSGRGSAVQFFEELLVSFVIYFFNELLLAVAVRIRGGRFLLPKAIVYDEWSWSPICRLGVYVLFMFLLYLCSLFVVLHFLATATPDDVDHCFLFMSIIFGFAVIVKPLLICTSLMAFWMASTTWKAGAVTQEMVSMVYIADKRPNTLSAKEIEKLDEDFAKKLLGLQDAGPVFFEDHHEPLQEEHPELQAGICSTSSWSEGPGRGSERGGKGSMIDRLIAADLQAPDVLPACKE